MRRVTVKFAWYDLWVGAYYDRTNRVWYVCPLPTLLVTIPRKQPRGEPFPPEWEKALADWQESGDV